MKFERTCIACRKKNCKDNFIKFVLNKNKSIFVDDDKNLDGRGAYVCSNMECLKKCIKTKALNRTFKFNIPQQFYEEISLKFGIKES